MWAAFDGTPCGCYGQVRRVRRAAHGPRSARSRFGRHSGSSCGARPEHEPSGRLLAAVRAACPCRAPGRHCDPLRRQAPGALRAADHRRSDRTDRDHASRRPPADRTRRRALPDRPRPEEAPNRPGREDAEPAAAPVRASRVGASLHDRPQVHVVLAPNCERRHAASSEHERSCALHRRRSASSLQEQRDHRDRDGRPTRRNGRPRPFWTV